MPLDAFTLCGLTKELQKTLIGGRIDKVLQPEKDELHLVIRSRTGTHRLVLSASANNPRIHITQHSKLNPLSAPMFCMLLRKKLISGQILEIVQDGMERVVRITAAVRDEMGEITALRLYAEIMGRHSNIILTDESNRILDSIKHVTEEMSRVREVLPGLPYTPPPPMDKTDTTGFSREDWQAFWQQAEGEVPAGYLAARAAGLSAVTARYLLADIPDTAKDKAEACYTAWKSVLSGEAIPRLLTDTEGQPRDFTLLECPGHTSRETASLSEAMDIFYAGRDLQQRMRERTSQIAQAVHIHLDRARRKLDKQLQTLEEAENADTYRLWGELLTAYKYMHTKGAAVMEVPNYYDPAQALIAIPLNPSKGPMDNAAAYYKKYKKARTAKELLQTQIAENQEEIGYLESIEVSIGECVDEAGIHEIREELVHAGYLREPKAKASRRLPPSKPMAFRAEDGSEILVGRNNKQNDTLTMHTADGEDVWFHTQKIPGSHVILRCNGQPPTPVGLETAANLAAWYSKARGASGIPVDYTLRKYVKKPGGAKPGFVTYTNQHTLIMQPTEAMIQRLQTIK